MMAGRLREKPRPVLHGAPLRIACRIIEPPNAREGNGSRAHGAGLERHIEVAAGEPLAAEFGARGADRQEAYRLVQGAAQRSAVGERAFDEELKADAGIAEWLSADEIERAMDLEHHLAGISASYRALGLDDEGLPAR